MSKNRTNILLVIAIMIVGINILMNSLFFLQPMDTTAGRATGTARVSISAIVAISLPVNDMNFGSLTLGATEDTTDMIPSPFTIRNDGNVQEDVTIQAADPLWDDAAAQSGSVYFQFKSAEKEAGSIGVGGTLISSFTNIPIQPGSPVTFATKLRYPLPNDELYGHIRVQVPEDEVEGSKTSTVTFTASQSV